ncbi:MAG: chorismate-binding protein, partial [Planctomycetota bacterium]
MANVDRTQLWQTVQAVLASSESPATDNRPATAPFGLIAVPIGIRLLSDQLTPVLAYRRLVAPDERAATSFLLESVEASGQGRYSLLGSRPAIEVTAKGDRVSVAATEPRSSGPRAMPAWALERLIAAGTRTDVGTGPTDPADTLRRVTSAVRFVRPDASHPSAALPDAPVGGWFGYAGYDTARYGEPGKLGFDRAPVDDRNLPDLAFALYSGATVFDHVQKLVHIVELAWIDPAWINPDERNRASCDAEHDRVLAVLDERAFELEQHSKPLPSGRIRAESAAPDGTPPPPPGRSDTTEADYHTMVERALEYIRAGDIFQVVLGQRFERTSHADPFDVYRALRAVNPSPYMAYMQCPGCILVASSPEILCRVERAAGFPSRHELTRVPLIKPADKLAGFAIKDAIDGMG